MSQELFNGYFLVAVGVLVGVVSVFAKLAWSLSSVITKLETSLNYMNDNHSRHEEILKEHDKRISDLEDLD